MAGQARERTTVRTDEGSTTYISLGDDAVFGNAGGDLMSGGGNQVLIVKAEAEDGGNKVVLGGRGYDVAFIEVASADLQAASDALAGFSGGPLTLEIAGNTIALF